MNPLIAEIPGVIPWIALPFFIGFSINLFPKLSRLLAVVVALSSMIYGAVQLLRPLPQTLEFLDHFGVTLQIDGLSGALILTNGIVTLAVLLYCWQTGKSTFFYTQLVILHGSVNAVFVCADFISLYVAVEVIGIAAFLLMTYTRSDRVLWVGLRYLFVSNTAMLFYLVGALLVYKSQHSFAFGGLGAAPPEAIALIILGLLTKGGVFISGLWLPLTHSEADTPVSALLSGVVIKAGIFPLVRCALIVPEVGEILAMLGMATALLGVVYAIWETDTKRLLALSTVSQVGFMLVSPPIAGFYALTHGCSKAALFLISGNLPSRQFSQLAKVPIPPVLRGGMAIAALSIAGLPGLSGFAAKTVAVKDVLPWQAMVLNIAAVGTAIAMAKFILIPFSSTPAPPPTQGLSLALLLLVGAIIAANGLGPTAYTVVNALKALGIIALGGLIYGFILQRWSIKLPRGGEQLEHLIGMMTLMLTALFWMVVT
ncbi:cation:proton antiporter [Spirulina sp. CCNP1310]|uniref:cation:proton antiporter n=1 Tax=Spirulina sp. CCNP1310 TaxID=3110249 RepID=UPI002B1F0BF0|nr:cation:proton antiporter [Spirulina sp. CCNP1310]MEA5421314.1 cation:proton antiporter [Spirulina sp. CCNP1310]